MENRYGLYSKFRLLTAIGLLVMQGACAPDGRAVLSDTAVYNNLVLKIEANRSHIRSGDSVQIRFTVINDGDQTSVIESSDTPVLEIIVEDVNSKKLFTSWSSQNPDKVVHRVEWGPRESKVLELQWTVPPEADNRLVFLGGNLSGNTRILQSANVSLCVHLCQ